MPLKPHVGAAAVVLLTSGTASFADDRATVGKFYDLLSNPGGAVEADAFRVASSPDWQSIGDYSGANKSREDFLGQMGGFAQLIPDLNWAIEELHQDGDTVIVRSRATGTPAAPFRGVDGQGRSFDMMTIDIHKFEDGLIVRTYHVEDWATALRQLSGQ